MLWSQNKPSTKTRGPKNGQTFTPLQSCFKFAWSIWQESQMVKHNLNIHRAQNSLHMNNEKRNVHEIVQKPYSTQKIANTS